MLYLTAVLLDGLARDVGVSMRRLVARAGSWDLVPNPHRRLTQQERPAPPGVISIEAGQTSAKINLRLNTGLGGGVHMRCLCENLHRAGHVGIRLRQCRQGHDLNTRTARAWFLLRSSSTSCSASLRSGGWSFRAVQRAVEPTGSAVPNYMRLHIGRLNAKSSTDPLRT